MNNMFKGPAAGELHGFLKFKRSLGYGYMRAEFTLREFDRFFSSAARNRRWRFDRAAIAWLSSKPGRKPISVSGDAAVLRQFYCYLRRSSKPGTVAEPIWPRLPTESSFVPYSLSEKDILHLLTLCDDLKRPSFRAALYRALILVLYCTGIRFGEALRLRMRDVDTRSAVLFVDTFKGRARWIPFHRSLSRELDRYRTERVAYAASEGDARFLDDLVPALDALGAVGRIIVAQAHVERGQRRLVDAFDLAVDELEHRIGRTLEPVIVVDSGLVETPLEDRVESIRRVGGDL